LLFLEQFDLGSAQPSNKFFVDQHQTAVWRLPIPVNTGLCFYHCRPYYWVNQ